MATEAGSPHDHTELRHEDVKTHRGSYATLALQLFIALTFMYLLMFLMIDSSAHFRHNLNFLYMAAAMVAPKGIVMVILMWAMFPRRWLNYAVMGALAVIYVGGIWFTRAQAFIDDTQFLRSMIPHHSGAILMCERANIADQELAALCEQIVQSQALEIAQMEQMLARMADG